MKQLRLVAQPNATAGSAVELSLWWSSLGRAELASSSAIVASSTLDSAHICTRCPSDGFMLSYWVSKLDQAGPVFDAWIWQSGCADCCHFLPLAFRRRPCSVLHQQLAHARGNMLECAVKFCHWNRRWVVLLRPLHSSRHSIAAAERSKCLSLPCGAGAWKHVGPPVGCCGFCFSCCWEDASAFQLHPVSGVSLSGVSLSGVSPPREMCQGGMGQAGALLDECTAALSELDWREVCSLTGSGSLTDFAVKRCLAAQPDAADGSDVERWSREEFNLGVASQWTN